MWNRPLPTLPKNLKIREYFNANQDIGRTWIFFFFVTKCKKYASFSCTLVISNNINVDDIFMYFSVAKATLESQMSVCHRNPSAPQKHAYQPNLNHVAIMPISNDATQPPCPPPLSLSESWLLAIMPISHHAHKAL